jgi:phage-related protein
MTTVAMPVVNKITLNSSLKVGFSQISAKFGDGYEQIAPNGLNNILDTWDIVWGALTTAEFQTVIAVLKSVGTWGIITWTPCDETVQKKFRISGDITRTREGTFYNVTCTIRQVFDV